MYADMQNVADVCSVCTIGITIKTFLKFSVKLNLHTAGLPTPEFMYTNIQTVCIETNLILILVRWYDVASPIRS